MPWQPDVRFNKLRQKSASLAFWASLETTGGLLLVIDDFFNATMSTNTRKNNGDRATSPEVVPTLAKKPSMADGDKEVFEDCLEEEDPILLELKEMLTNIQTSILSILKENAKLNKDKAEPKSSLKSNERELKELKASLALANTQN